MMKFGLRVLLVAIAAITMTSLTVSASTISCGDAGEINLGTDVSTTRTIALEAVTGATLVANYYTVDLDDAVDTPAEVGALAADTDNPLTGAGDKIGFQTSYGMNAGDLITITFTNALFMDADVYLVAEEVGAQQPVTGVFDFDADGNTNDVIEIASNFGTLDATNGVSSITLRVNNGNILPTGMQMHLVVNTSACENADDGAIDDDTENPTFKILPNVSSGDRVGMTVTAVMGATPIGAAACTGNIFEIEQQFNFAVTTAGTSTIDVESAAGNRWNFLEEGAAGDVLGSANDTDLTVSGCVYTYSNDTGASVIEDFITLTVADSLVITLTSSGDLSQVSHVLGNVFIETDDNPLVAGGNDYTFGTPTANTLTTLIPGSRLDTVAPETNTLIDDIAITVLGAGIINSRNWTVGAVLNLVQAGFASEQAATSYGPAASHTWITNGSQFVVPHMYSRSGWETYFVLKSQHTQSSSTVTVDMLAKDGTWVPNMAYSIQLPDSITGGGSLYISADQLMTEAGWTASGLDKDFSAVFTLTVPNDQIQADAYRYNSGNGAFFNATLYQKKVYDDAGSLQWEK